MSPLPEQQFLRHCMRTLWEPSALEQACALTLPPAFDWATLLRDAAVERVEALLYHAVRGQSVVPAPVEIALGDAYYSLAAQNTLLLHELERVVGAMAEASVPVLLLKGAALVQTAYGNAALRPMADLDVLVPRKRAGTAEGVLCGLGYGMTSGEPWRGFSRRYRSSAMFGRPTSANPFFYVGLHTHLYDVPFYEHIPVDDLFARALPLPGAETKAAVPAPEDHLVYLCGHLALHHEGEPALLRYVDMAVLTQRTGKTLDWGQVVRRAKEWRLVLPLRRSLAGLDELWPGVVPASAAAEAARLRPGASERRLHAWTARLGRTPAATMLLALATMPGVGRRAGYFAEQAFPSPCYMRRRYFPRHPGLWPLAYLVRTGLALRHFSGLRRRAPPSGRIGRAVVDITD